MCKATNIQTKVLTSSSNTNSARTVMPNPKYVQKLVPVLMAKKKVTVEEDLCMVDSGDFLDSIKEEPMDAQQTQKLATKNTSNTFLISETAMKPLSLKQSSLIKANNLAVKRASPENGREQPSKRLKLRVKCSVCKATFENIDVFKEHFRLKHVPAPGKFIPPVTYFFLKLMQIY